MKRLVIAESASIICDILRDALCQDFEVHICEYGKELPAVLEELRPEALIINLSLKGMDTVTALSGCQYKPPAILALTYFISDRIVENASFAGIGDIILLPSSKAEILSRFFSLSKKHNHFNVIK